MKLSVLVLGFFTCLSSTGFAQEILSPADFINLVKQNHPFAKQASLDVEISKANILASRSVFDPNLQLNGSSKSFEATRYYKRQVAELNIPLWFGVDLYTGSMYNTGDRVNPETTKGRSYFTGISVPLLRNFLIDERKAVVRSATLLKDQALVKQRMALNELVAEAMLVYWKWWEHNRMLDEVSKSVNNAEERFRMVKTLFRQGERPAIDTLEALNQVLSLKARQTEVRSMLQVSRQHMALFAFKDSLEHGFADDLVPVEDILPGTGMGSLEEYTSSHPSVLIAGLALENLRIEKRLKLQQLLPSVKFTFENLSRDLFKSADQLPGNNFYYGLSMSVPLRLSEARGELRATRLNMLKTELEQSLNEARVQTSILQYNTERRFLEEQVSQQQELVSTYSAVQRGEEMKFYGGESSLFIVNERESRTLEARQKLIKLKSSLMQASIKMRLAAANFN